MTLSRLELAEKSSQFIAFLAQEGINAFLMEESFRDYNVKVRLPEGNLILYHKPTKQSFSLGTHEYKGDKSAAEALWHRFLYPKEEVRGLCAYVDGSFHRGRCAWGLVMAQDSRILAEKGGIVPMNAEDSARQIAGEVTAVLEAVAFAQEQGAKELHIFFDYLGLQCWAQGTWKARSPIAQYYAAKLMQLRGVALHWHKVKAHSGHPLNSRADALAKAAAEGSF